ncbi:MAG TPA: hypothetical protein DCE44_17710, partial [Verrucomicrobiales bacterium]|nr:hypothetical protein [Verrucomicrobiales bacterium]
MGKTRIPPTLLALPLGLAIAAAQPVITTQPQPQTKFAGESALLSVEATGTPPLSYQWFKAFTPLEGQTNSTLSLTNLQAADRGTYSVIVSNLEEPVTSTPVEVIVVTAPRITPAN